MSGLIAAVGQIVAAHASKSPMTSEQVLAEIANVHSALANLNRCSPNRVEVPVVTYRKAFRKSEVVCMLCGRGMKTLKRHLAAVHAMKPKEYRAKFGIPTHQPLIAENFSAARRDLATARGLAGYLVKARAARQENLKGKRNDRVGVS